MNAASASTNAGKGTNNEFELNQAFEAQNRKKKGGRGCLGVMVSLKLLIILAFKLGGVMKRLILVGVMLLSVSTAFAYDITDVGPIGGPYTFDNTGIYLGTILGENDDVATIEGVLSQLLIDADIISSAKVDYDNYPSNTTNIDFYLRVTYADPSYDGSGNLEGYKSGQWFTYPPPNEPVPPNAQLVHFYTVKGGNDFALYEVVGGSAFGGWNVENLLVGKKNAPDISHFSGYSTTQPVPEPISMLLFGTGLMATGGYAQIRSKKKKTN
jgi:hypothetical protein